MTSKEGRARRRGRAGEVVPAGIGPVGADAGAKHRGSDVDRHVGGRMSDDVRGALAENVFLGHRRHVASARRYASSRDVQGAKALDDVRRMEAPLPDRRSARMRDAQANAGMLRFPGVPSAASGNGSDAGVAAVHWDERCPIPDLDEMASFVAAVAGDEEIRRWCVVALATADPSPRRDWVYDPIAATLTCRLDPSVASRAGHGGFRRPGRTRSVTMPTVAALEMASWDGVPGVDLTPGRLRRRVVRLQADDVAVRRLAPSTLHRFVLDALVRGPFAIDLATLDAWLGRRRLDVRRHARRFGLIDLSEVTGAMQDLLLDVDARSGGVLFRAGRGAGKAA